MFSNMLIANRGDQRPRKGCAAAQPNRLQAHSAVAGDLAAHILEAC
jgi:hypothetical protein